MPDFLFGQIPPQQEQHNRGVTVGVNWVADLLGLERNPQFDQQPRHVSVPAKQPTPTPTISAEEQQRRAAGGRDAPAQGQGGLRLALDKTDP